MFFSTVVAMMCKHTMQFICNTTSVISLLYILIFASACFISHIVQLLLNIKLVSILAGMAHPHSLMKRLKMAIMPVMGLQVPLMRPGTFF